MNIQALNALQGLGYGILAASSVIKVPQILALLKSKSAEGLAGLSFELENICFTIHASYGLLMGLPINSYGKACSFPQALNGGTQSAPTLSAPLPHHGGMQP